MSKYHLPQRSAYISDIFFYNFQSPEAMVSLKQGVPMKLLLSTIFLLTSNLALAQNSTPICSLAIHKTVQRDIEEAIFSRLYGKVRFSNSKSEFGIKSHERIQGTGKLEVFGEEIFVQQDSLELFQNGTSIVKTPFEDRRRYFENSFNLIELKLKELHCFR